MNGLVDSPSRVSTLCSSCLVPSVAATSACVSPRVKSAEPWVRGRNDTSALIARVSVDFRPSIRTPSSRTIRRTSCFSSLSRYSRTFAFRSPSGSTAAMTSWASFVSPWARCAFSGIRTTSRILPRVASRTWASSAGSWWAEASNSHRGLPASWASARWTRTSARHSSCARAMASTRVSSDTSRAPASTIITESSVAATTRSSVLRSRSAKGGFTTSRPSMCPMRTAPKGPRNGTPATQHRGRRPVHRQDAGIVLLVRRDRQHDELDLVPEALGEERAERAVDQPGGEDLLLGRTPLALEEAAGDAPAGVGPLAVVDAEGKEVLPLGRGPAQPRRWRGPPCRRSGPGPTRPPAWPHGRSRG